MTCLQKCNLKSYFSIIIKGKVQIPPQCIIEHHGLLQVVGMNLFLLYTSKVTINAQIYMGHRTVPLQIVMSILILYTHVGRFQGAWNDPN